MSHHYLDVRDLRYAYPDGTEALKGVSFRLEHGEACALVGANGAGKSTMMLALTGLILPSGGTMDVGGTVLSKKTAADVRRRIGFVFQDSEDQLFMPTVFDDVAFGPGNLGLTPAEVDARVHEALEAVGMSEYAGRPPHHLSFGQRRRVAVATVLAMRPEILVLDEPSSNLDPASRRELAEILTALDVTILMVTHDLPYAMQLCERSVVLANGVIVADGPTREVLSNAPLMATHRLELPFGFDPTRV